MIALVLCGLLGAVSAAPQYYHGYGHWPSYDPFNPYVRDNLLDTQSVWANLANEMQQLDEMMRQLTTRFQSVVSEGVVEGNTYKITITLNGFDEKDIHVKAREGVLMIQATNEFNNYLNLRNLPCNVNPEGNWVYENNVLTISFPLKQKDGETTEVIQETTEEVQTEESRREEMEPVTDNNVQDADVGLLNQELEKQDEISNSIEATTYVINKKDEYEFVPMAY